MHGWDLDVKKRRNLKYAEMEVWSLFKYIVILRKRGNLISVGFFGNAYDLLCSIAVAHIVTLKVM